MAGILRKDQFKKEQAAQARGTAWCSACLPPTEARVSTYLATDRETCEVVFYLCLDVRFEAFQPGRRARLLPGGCIYTLRPQRAGPASSLVADQKKSAAQHASVGDPRRGLPPPAARRRQSAGRNR
jgi:hypothetical protein